MQVMQYNYGYVYRLFTAGGHGYQEVTHGYYLLYQNAKKAQAEGNDPYLFIDTIKLKDYGPHNEN